MEQCPLGVALQAYRMAFERTRLMPDARDERIVMLEIAKQATKVALRHLESLTSNPSALVSEDATS